MKSGGVDRSRGCREYLQAVIRPSQGEAAEGLSRRGHRKESRDLPILQQRVLRPPVLVEKVKEGRPR